MRTTRRTLAVSAALAALVLGALPARAAPPIIAGALTNTPPMLSYAADGTTLQGVIVDLAAEMSKRLGRQIEFKSMPFPGLLPAMQSKQIDIAFTLMNDTAERQKVVDFVDYYNFGTKLLVRKGNPEHIAGLESLCGKTAATVQGSTQVALVDDASAKCTAAGKPAITNLQFGQPADARLQVQTGRAAVFLGNSPVMVYLAQTAGDGKLFDVVPGVEYQPVPVGIAVAKDNPALRDELQKALAAMIADGSYLRILEKYGVESGAVKTAAINGGH